MTEQEKLITKIEKLIAKGRGTDNADEAAIFLQKAADIMAEHNLSNRDITKNQLGEAFIRSTQSISKFKDWEINLMVIIGKAFGCKVTSQAGNIKNKPDYWGRFYFRGQKDQVMLAEYTGTYLLRILIKARSKYATTLKAHGHGRSKEMTAHLDAFCKGWIAVIKTKVHAFVNSPELQAVLDEEIERITKGNKTESQNRGDHPASRINGQNAAADIHINRPMDNVEQLKLR